MFSDDDQLIGNPTLDQTIEKNGINDSLSTPGTSKVQPTFDAFQQCHLDGHEVDIFFAKYNRVSSEYECVWKNKVTSSIAVPLFLLVFKTSILLFR